MNTCTWCGDTIETGIDNQHRCKPDREPMSFFNELPEEAKKKAYENLAYELLDNYLQTTLGGDEQYAEERLMNCLKGEKMYHHLYQSWESSNA
jgi:hypothetical protein